MCYAGTRVPLWNNISKGIACSDLESTRRKNHEIVCSVPEHSSVIPPHSAIRSICITRSVTRC